MTRQRLLALAAAAPCLCRQGGAEERREVSSTQLQAAPRKVKWPTSSAFFQRFSMVFTEFHCFSLFFNDFQWAFSVLFMVSMRLSMTSRRGAAIGAAVIFFSLPR